MKTMKKLLAIFMILSLVLSLGVVTAFATSDDPDPAAGGDDGPATAEENQYEGEVGELAEIAGETMTFDKYLVLNKGADVPDVQFKFVITAGEAGGEAYESVFILPKDKDDDENDYNVIGKPVFVAGTDMETATTTYADDSVILTYAKGDTTTDEADAPTEAPMQTIAFMTADPTTDEKYATKTMTISFAGVTFVEPGVYRYTITEDSAYTDETTPLPGMVYDPGVAESCVRYLDVYVIDNEGSLEVASYVLHENAAAPAEGDDAGTAESEYADPSVISADAENELKDKSTGFSNQYDSKSLAFKKEVTGNQASRDKYFKYTLTITLPDNVDADAFNAKWYEIDMEQSSWVWEPTKNVSTSYDAADMKAANDPNSTDDSNMKVEDGRVYILGSALTGGKEFYLQHGNYIQIRNLPALCEYEVVEEAEDYKSTEAGVADYENATSGTLKTEDENPRGDSEPEDPDDIVFTSYLNTRDGVIPTGIISVIAPAVAVIVLGAAGLGFVLVSKNRKEEEA